MKSIANVCLYPFASLNSFEGKGRKTQAVEFVPSRNILWTVSEISAGSKSCMLVVYWYFNCFTQLWSLTARSLWARCQLWCGIVELLYGRTGSRVEQTSLLYSQHVALLKRKVLSIWPILKSVWSLRGSIMNMQWQQPIRWLICSSYANGNKKNTLQLTGAQSCVLTSPQRRRYVRKSTPSCKSVIRTLPFPNTD